MAWGRYRNIFSAREVETKRKIRGRWIDRLIKVIDHIIGMAKN